MITSRQKAILVFGLLLLLGTVQFYGIIKSISEDGLSYHALKADYTSFLLGGRLLAQGDNQAVNLYNLGLQQQVQQAMIAGSDIKFYAGLLPFISPPVVALLTLPLVGLPPAASFVLWDVIQLLILLLSLWLLQPMLPRGAHYWLWLGAAAFLPIGVIFSEGQISAIALLALALLWRGLKAGGRGNWRGGAALALMLVKLQLLPLFLLYLLYKRNWRALGGFSVVASGFYLLCAAVSGFDWPFTYLAALVNSQQSGYGYQPELMFNLASLLIRLNLDSQLLFYLSSAAVVIVLLIAWGRSAHSADMGAEKMELQLALTAIGTTLISTHLYPHDLVILIFSGAALTTWAARHNWPLWSSGLLAVTLLTSLLVMYKSFYWLIFLILLVGVFIALAFVLIRPTSTRQALVSQQAELPPCPLLGENWRIFGCVLPQVLTTSPLPSTAICAVSV